MSQYYTLHDSFNFIKMVYMCNFTNRHAQASTIHNSIWEVPGSTLGHQAAQMSG
jgi:hypothetical protein